jgi:hypothetical protein
MSTLSFGIWGATTKFIPSVDFYIFKINADATFSSVKNYVLPRVSGPHQITIVEDGTTVSSFVLDSERPIPQSIVTTTRGIPHVAYTGIGQNSTVAYSSPTSSTDMRLDWFTITTPTTTQYRFKISPYDGIPTLLSYVSGPVPGTVTVYIENAGENTIRSESTETFTTLPQNIPRITGLSKLTIRNPDGSWLWLEIDGRQYGNVRQNGGDTTYTVSLRSGSTPFGCTTIYDTRSTQQKTYLTITSGTYIYSLMMPSSDTPMELSFDPASTGIGVGENVQVTTTYYKQR